MKKRGFHKTGPVFVNSGSTYLTAATFSLPKSTSPRATWRKEAIQMSALRGGGLEYILRVG